MEEFRYIYGPIPSRRLGRSAGISPIMNNTCNQTCIYCQLGRIRHMTNERMEYVPLQDILDEFSLFAEQEQGKYDIVTICGDGEPTLYSRLGELIRGLKARTDQPVAVITNGGLLYDAQVRSELMEADIVLPSLDAVNQQQYQKVNRPRKEIDYYAMLKGLIEFSRDYKGQLWLEIMLVDGYNTDDEDIKAFVSYSHLIRTDRIYINTPVRCPAESDAKPAAPETILKACLAMNAINIDMLTSSTYTSDIEDDYEAYLNIAIRHPLNEEEIRKFLQNRNCQDIEGFLKRLESDEQIKVSRQGELKTYMVRKA